jgi:hypothetical protein
MSAGKWIDRHPTCWFGVGVSNGTQRAAVATGHDEQCRVFAYAVWLVQQANDGRVCNEEYSH